MQSCSSTPRGQSTTVREFVSRKTETFPGAWMKGRSLGFTDSQLMLGFKVTSLEKPGPSTYKHPLSDRYVRLDSQSTSGIRNARLAIESDFNVDFKTILQSDRLDASQVINRLLEYDQFMQKAVQDIPENVTIPEFIFDHTPDKNKPWLKDHGKIRDTLFWVAEKMMDDEECRPNSLTMLLASWIELTNGMVMNKANYTNGHVKPYFDWQAVFAYVEKRLGLSDVAFSRPSAEVGTPSVSKSTTRSRKRKQTAEVDHQGKRKKTVSTPARKITEQLESLEKCINDLNKTPVSQMKRSERSEIAEQMLSIFTRLTKFPVRHQTSGSST